MEKDILTFRNVATAKLAETSEILAKLLCSA